MHLFTATEFEGELKSDCDEGDLKWIDKDKMYSLPHWEGDKIFLDLIRDENYPFFKLTLSYNEDGSKLTQAILNGKELTLS